MEKRYDVLIVGAGHAGAQTAIALRHQKFEGTIAIIGEEPELPYERPPLSKEYLAGEKTFDRLLIRPPAFWSDRHVDFLLGRRVCTVDPVERNVGCDDGEIVAYGRLVWAAGGHARRMNCAGHDLAGVHTVRSRADVDRMMAELPDIARVVVIGGGYIGLEAAAVLTKLGKQVTVLEALDRVLARVAGEPLSRFFEQEHRAHGVDVRLGTSVATLLGSEGHVRGVRLTNGLDVRADMVIVGIGIVPAVEPLLMEGADGGNGVAVDAHGKTSLENVYAVGDCALHANAFADHLPIRLESVQNANDMATVVAKSIMGQAEAYHAVPWFWSNQYDLRLQTIGLSTGHDRIVVRGDQTSRSFSIVYLKQGQVIALDCVNATKDYVQGKSLVVGRREIAPDRLQNTNIPLKEM